MENVCQGTEGRVHDVALQPDGKIVTAGRTGLDNGSFDFCVARFLPSGAPDPSFGGGDGWTPVTNDGDSQEDAFALALAPDGKIVLAGWTDVDGSASGATRQWWVVRFTSTGAPDDDFGTGGKVTVATSGRSEANAVHVEADREVVVTGTIDMLDQADFGGVRLEEDGDIDPQWAFGFATRTDLAPMSVSDDFAADSVLLPDGRVAVGGGSIDDRFAVLLYGENGLVDSDWGTTGTLLPSICADDAMRAMLRQPDGKLLLAGVGDFNSGDGLAMMRVNPTDASVDTSFNADGATDCGATPKPGMLYEEIDLETNTADLTFAADGRILAAGEVYDPSADDETMLALVTPAGELDTSFDGDGFRILSIIGGDREDGLEGVAVQPDGRIVGGGYRESAASSYEGMLTRFDGPPPPAPPGPGGITPGGPAGTALRAGVAARVSACKPAANGRVQCTLVNTNPFDVTGTLALQSSKKLRVAARRPKPKTLLFGRKSFTLKANGRATVTLKLSRKNQARLRRLKKVRVKLAVTVTDEAGVKRAATKAFTLKPYKKPRKRRRT